jgi:invasion protein IalB
MPASADDTGLPGGATSLREAHGDWAVSCSVQTANSKTTKACALSQELTDRKSGQRVLAIEVRPAGTAADGTLVLPFGLALAKGATLQIDDGQASSALAFRTCLPAGCVVPVNFDTKMLAALRSGAALKVKATRDGGGDVQFSLSLKGFGGAFDRTATLLK